MATRGPNKMPRRTWSSDEVVWLGQHLHLSKKAIADHIGCTPDSVKTALRKHGLKLKSTGRFEKGAIPFYKGKKLPDAVKAKVAHGWFRKGHKPHNTKHVGHVSVRRDAGGRQYFWIIAGEKKYVMLHRHLWEQAHGPVPNGHRVCFKDGNQGNCTLDNLELLSDQEAMARNTIGRYPKEIQDVMRTLGRLNREIKRTQDPNDHE
jgi:hypothetical protein